MNALLVTYALCFGGAAVSLVRPFYGLLVYILFAIIKPESLWFYAVPAGNYSRIVAIGLLVGWALHGFGNWRFGKASAIVKCLLAFWCWSVVSMAFSEQPAVAYGFVEAQLKIVLPFVAGMTLIDSSAKVMQVAWTIVLAQGYVALEMNRYYFGGYNWLLLGEFAGQDNNSNAIAIVTAVGMAFFLGLHESRLWRKCLALGFAAHLAHAVFFSFSRGAMLALCCSGVACFVLIPKTPRTLALFAFAALLAVRMAGPEVIERFSSTFADPEVRDASAQSRLDIWSDCIDVMANHPIVGVGPDHWVLVSYEYGWDGLMVHSLWLTAGAEMGVVGMLLLIGFYALTMRSLWRIVRRQAKAPTTWHVSAARMVISSLVGFMVAASFVSLNRLEIPYYVTLVGAATVMLRGREQARENALAAAAPEWEPLPDWPAGEGAAAPRSSLGAAAASR